MRNGSPEALIPEERRRDMRTITLNFNKLKGKIREKGLTQVQLAKMVGMSPSVMNQKLNNKSDFTLMESFVIGKVLGIDDMNAYFFNEELP